MVRILQHGSVYGEAYKPVFNGQQSLARSLVAVVKVSCTVERYLESTLLPCRVGINDIAAEGIIPVHALVAQHRQTRSRPLTVSAHPTVPSHAAHCNVGVSPPANGKTLCVCWLPAARCLPAPSVANLSLATSSGRRIVVIARLTTKHPRHLREQHPPGTVDLVG